MGEGSPVGKPARKPSLVRFAVCGKIIPQETVSNTIVMHNLGNVQDRSCLISCV